MPALASDLRRQLENVITDAREKAEAAARAALKRLAVDAPKPFDHFGTEQRELRNRLRARARQAGDLRKSNREQEIDQLTQELAYEYWHRMLFARFLAENHLLMHPDGVAVSLAECDELAKHEGVENGFVLAARYASRMLPQIFRTDDVLLEVDFPINDRLPLEKLLASLPTDTFTADDSLGWVYQFWQAKKKDAVNKSGEKIDGRTLPAVTQLFTEPYMVKFLLHNTIGAWWCARHGIKGPPDGAGVPNGQTPVEMEYLRWRDDGTPAAGAFDGWPNNLNDFTMLDPCCGSGHFLVEAFNLLVPMRMHDEGLSAQEACDAALAENLFGLELDPRCTQIAAFALALAAWKFRRESGEPLGYRWPEQPKEVDVVDVLADKDGIVSITAVRGERPAAERLLEVLRAAYDSEWSDTTLHKLLLDAGCRPGSSLDEWLRDTFFEQHCKRFHNRLFIWHIWDGRKDGFSCLVNYHKLNHKLLETLTYSYLQDWITAQAAAAKDGKPGADLRLAAAQELQNKLKLILAGEPPYDIFARWKPLEEQPIGWNPDLNDGVRSNIRPFMTADVLRKKPSINWSKDRGKEPGRTQDQYPWFWKDGKFTGDRVNDYHLANAQKRAARAA